MIIIINGSFGVGKTTIASGLASKMQNAMVYDPEEVGSALRALTEGVRTADETTDDFRDIKLWPELVVTVAKSLQKQYGKDLVVPMTLDNLVHLKAIRHGFEQFDSEVYHFCLIAPLEIILNRIQSRHEGNGEWTIRKATECVAKFIGAEYEKYIDTTHITPDEIVQVIYQQTHSN